MATQDLAKSSKGQTLPELLKMDAVKKRIKDVTGKTPAAVTSAALSVFNANDLLKQCDPNSIVTAIVQAAVCNLQINPSYP